ncbi:uncharacterized protein PV09_04706 [Verruconis gallopava]|uniref:Uncharacterized protein n=1 Tax=Verruconis gallopava TaxID=253628 RepID=A0A0D2AZ82_9PEZI|nr:uncharacterized protein PV09_04706 [Verruconis gallopava]KIW04439.1 hypothetical protein PV09_04706 [Verruconis gallopava]
MTPKKRKSPGSCSGLEKAQEPLDGWFYSGAGVESLLVTYAASLGTRILPSVPLWTLLTTLNLVYAVASTSRLLNGLFASTCWPVIFITCLFQFQSASELAQRNLRRVLRDISFTRYTIALFNLPALDIDMEVSGQMVIRLVTVCLSSLTLIAHGVEVGIKVTDDIELAVYTEQVCASLFRKIEISDIFGNVKGGSTEMTFADVKDSDNEADEESLFNETPLLRAAAAGSEGLKIRPKSRESLAGRSYIKGFSVQAGFDDIRALSPNDQNEKQKYLKMLNDIRTTCAVYQCPALVREAAKEQGRTLRMKKM